MTKEGSKSYPVIALDEDTRQNLSLQSSGILANPYSAYQQFSLEVKSTISASYLEKLSDIDFEEHPYVVIKNVPIDSFLPSLSNVDPVNEKRRQKKTFVSEVMLEIIAYAIGTNPIGYMHTNNGDRFADVFPIKSLDGTQSQKTAQGMNFHKDLANNPGSPDFFIMLGLNVDTTAQIATRIAKNREIINMLSEEATQLLSRPIFYTKHSDLSKLGGCADESEPVLHPIIIGSELRYFEGKTLAFSDENIDFALEELSQAADKLAVDVVVGTGNALIVNNMRCIHSKYVPPTATDEARWNRWIQKLCTINDLSRVNELLIEPGLVGLNSNEY